MRIHFSLEISISFSNNVVIKKMVFTTVAAMSKLGEDAVDIQKNNCKLKKAFSLVIKELRDLDKNILSTTGL